MRAFVGIKLEECKPDIEKIIESLYIKDKFANYTLISNIHLTLQFLGDISSLEVKKVENIFSTINEQSFDILLNKITNLKDMVILSVENNNYLNALQTKLKVALQSSGFKVEDRKFFPHITIARKSSTRIDEFINLKFRVKEVILFSSTRVNNQLVYTPILKRELNKNY